MTVSVAPPLTAGTYSYDVVGTSSPSGIEQRAPVTMHAFDQVPGAITLVAPANGATGVAVVPTLSWTAAAQGDGYYIEVATDPAFTQMVYNNGVVLELAHTLVYPLEPETLYYWRVQGGNPCGDGPWSPVFSFTTRAIPPILLVDDDDNSPDVRPTYTAGLDALGLQYDVWDTGNSDVEPSGAELAPYRTVIWFTGDEFGGVAGPGAATEADLASWLAGGPTLPHDQRPGLLLRPGADRVHAGLPRSRSGDLGHRTDHGDRNRFGLRRSRSVLADLPVLELQRHHDPQRRAVLWPSTATRAAPRSAGGPVSASPPSGASRGRRFPPRPIVRRRCRPSSMSASRGRRGCSVTVSKAAICPPGHMTEP